MRLTEKTDNGYALTRNLLKVGNASLLIAQIVTDKLGQLEDIEEELGIELVTLFKALTQPFYVKHCDKILKTHLSNNGSNSHYCQIECMKSDYGNGIVIKTDIYDKEENMNHSKILFLEDYGKTWALTREELL